MSEIQKRKLHKLDVAGRPHRVLSEDIRALLGTHYADTNTAFALVVKGGTSSIKNSRTFIDSFYEVGYVKNLVIEKTEGGTYLMGDVYITIPLSLDNTKLEDTSIGMAGFFGPRSLIQPYTSDPFRLAKISHFVLLTEKETT